MGPEISVSVSPGIVFHMPHYLPATSNPERNLRTISRYQWGKQNAMHERLSGLFPKLIPVHLRMYIRAELPRWQVQSCDPSAPTSRWARRQGKVSPNSMLIFNVALKTVNLSLPRNQSLTKNSFKFLHACDMPSMRAIDQQRRMSARAFLHQEKDNDPSWKFRVRCCQQKMPEGRPSQYLCVVW